MADLVLEGCSRVLYATSEDLAQHAIFHGAI